MNDDGFDLLYPDVLGAITGGSRFTIGDLQVAVGIFPDRTYINQPIEVIVILQNMIDSNLQVRVGVGFPAEDKKGRPVVIDTPQKITDITVGPGEVGTLRIPIIPLPPTQSGMHFPVRVAIRYRPSVKNPQTVRPPAGGAPPTVLSVSPFKLQALQEVTFNASLWQESTDVITVHFDIAPRRVALPQQNFATRYEILWTHAGMEEQRTLAREQVNDAHYVASNFTVSNVFIPLLAAVSERFAERNLVLHPGEAAAITKIIAYALDEGLIVEQAFPVEDSRWFKTLCQVMAYDEAARYNDPGALVVQYLFDAAIYDAVLLGFILLQKRVRENLGDKAERVNYDNRLLSWLGGKGQADLTYIYLPLALAGLLINPIVHVSSLNPWTLVNQLEEAYRGRIRLASGEAEAVFSMLNQLLAYGENELRRLNIQRP